MNIGYVFIGHICLLYNGYMLGGNMSDKVTDEEIKLYCERMGYELESIEEISFIYKKKDGSRAALLKGAVPHITWVST